MITTIIFDLSEVFLKGFSGVENFLTGFLNMGSSEIKRRLDGPEFKLLLEDEIDEDAFWKMVIKRNKWDVSPELFKHAVRKNFDEIQGTREIIKQLKLKGYKLGLLSDHSKEWIDYCSRKFNYSLLFDFVQYSFETKSCKTEINTFRKVLEKSGEEAENCLFVDDNKKNIKVAESAGLKTIHFESPEQLKEELVSAGILS
ncbi:hypothetical protein A3K73_04315 [Candidatus Pacearchaeota archaeon RBG_13_36_9]|nr:MAG: hypothetical protein A3K73_04315 [Candidatus Pacearchaeota archaeon RBG_13_36_9]